MTHNINEKFYTDIIMLEEKKNYLLAYQKYLCILGAPILFLLTKIGYW